MVNYVVLVLAMIFEGAAWTFAFSEFNKIQGQVGLPRGRAARQGPHPVRGAVRGLGGDAGPANRLPRRGLTQITGILYFDGIASILIGLMLGGTAAWLAYETKGLLIGEAANDRVVNGIRDIVLSFEEVDSHQ